MLPAADEIKARIAQRGPIPFAEFMEVALYWPWGGFYPERGPAPAPRDYFTSPMAHPLFGALLALQLEEMWRLLGGPAPFFVVEAGAGRGELARDIRGYAPHLDPAFATALRYVALDRAQRPDGEAGNGHSWWLMATGIPLRSVTGCILAHELLDAFPVHRVTVAAGRLREISVGLRQGHLCEVLDEPSTPALAARLEERGIALVEGQRAEVCLGLEPWLEEVAAALGRGFILIIDYGHTARELYSAERMQGTLRCYYRHTVAADPYVRVGEQDITAHVDLSSTVDIGQRLGLEPAGPITQREFLGRLGLGSFQARLSSLGLPQVERDANRMGMLELARPSGLGEFKVLVQAKAVAAPALTGLAGSSPSWLERLRGFPVPLLGREHLSLLAARYPHAARGWEDVWPGEP